MPGAGKQSFQDKSMTKQELGHEGVMLVKRMEEISSVRELTPESDPEYDGSFSLRGKVVPEGVVLYRFNGPLFFAAADNLEAALRASGGKPRAVVFRMRYVPVMDATGLQALRTAVEKMQRDGVLVLLTGIQPQPMSVVHKSGVADLIGIENFCGDIDEALDACRRHIGGSAPGGPEVG